MSKQLSIVLPTTIALLERFQTTLSAPAQDAPVSAELTEKDALPLLSASSTALKSQVTKLSLLAITSPLTHSAVSTVLSALNESVLPSLVTAALLITPANYTKAFHAEVQVLTKTALKEVSLLVAEVKSVAEKKDKAKDEGKKESELSQSEKDVVTVATGRVWESCDVLVDVAAKGVVGFVVRRVEEWRDLVRDAVEEIEEWDPDEDEDEFYDELLGDDGNKDAEAGSDNEEDDEESSAALHAHKKSTMRILKPVAQIYPAILMNRLKNAGNKPLSSPSGVNKLESLMTNLQSIPENIDEVAGALYEDNLDKCTRYLKDVRSKATRSLNLVVLPWGSVEGNNSQEKAEDKFTTWSRTWMKVMDEVSKSVDETK
ncbi:hypothetical protein ASPWEDRAFT_115358 [Aspergillus wentii DTO 134E9]|uniref:Cyclin-D1-binding protein 1-like N-terminal domain-containing protein n=1 Tax=Aspergillus wentii DTO 134E9 TaxID=1073089 RepID=A0A1L9RE14_ASPWE|nr:uncharacterized protein ASPWEDRAFT_115358 [Aspergillus wentii DTO 134E9]OJJ33155.1 hypothetical protein ASPWEDRAFT_115358 [Aspergillus wentii DTO 134E9]